MNSARANTEKAEHEAATEQGHDGGEPAGGGVSEESAELADASTRIQVASADARLVDSDLAVADG